jgi:hypothetical protein
MVIPIKFKPKIVKAVEKPVAASKPLIPESQLGEQSEFPVMGQLPGVTAAAAAAIVDPAQP